MKHAKGCATSWFEPFSASIGNHVCPTCKASSQRAVGRHVRQSRNWDANAENSEPARVASDIPMESLNFSVANNRQESLDCSSFGRLLGQFEVFRNSPAHPLSSSRLTSKPAQILNRRPKTLLGPILPSYYLKQDFDSGRHGVLKQGERALKILTQTPSSETRLVSNYLEPGVPTSVSKR